VDIPETSKSFGVNPYPRISNVYGFSSESLLLIDTVAFRLPSPDGSKVIWKDVVPPDAAMEAAGMAVTKKSEAFVPLSVT
jgi:hypothetical protein